MLDTQRNELRVLGEAVGKQKLFVDSWRKPVEPLLFETVRALDNLFMQALFLPESSAERTSNELYALSTWGVNQALARMMPDVLSNGPFRFFPSTAQTQRQANEFILQCGILERARILYGWLEDGLLSARLDLLAQPLRSGTNQILVLKTKHPSLYCEAIARESRGWMSRRTMEYDRHWEKRLREQHAELLPDLERRVGKFNNWGISYSTTKEIDDHFLECGQVYLRRMWSQDLLGLEDKLGGSQFSDYLGLLAALAGRSEKHHCFSLILKRRYPELSLQNLLTTFAPYDEFVNGLADHLDADTRQIQKLLRSVTLEPQNREAHTGSTDTAWAPVVRSSLGVCILPLFGMEINPILFLLNDLRTKYSEDWDRAANNREKRWIIDLKRIFSHERWRVRDGNLKLRDSGKTVTDVDFVAYDSVSNELAIFQLKWQQPVGFDNRARRSAGRNLVSEGNRWISAVNGWIGKYGLEELARRSQIKVRRGVVARLFVVARYGARFPGFSGQDGRAVWVDWNHLIRARAENPEASVVQLARVVDEEVRGMTESLSEESYMFPLDDLAVILNPTMEPIEDK